MNTLFTYDTIRNADSVEWCPHKPHQNIFVCANYELIEKTTENEISSRVGRILVFSVDPTRGLQEIQALDTAGILDQKWCHNRISGFSILGVVNAENSIQIYKLNNSEVQLEYVTKIVFENLEVLILSLDWSTGKYESDSPEIICSDSSGCIRRLKFESNELFKIEKYEGHKFEAWIAAFNYWDTNTFFSGGDDALFLQFDTRTGTLPILKNRLHQAGVTSIHSNTKYEHLLATGSYDTFLRFWDLRKMKQPSFELELPGTLWRLKWNPLDQQHLLAACMLGGAHILKLNQFNDAEVVASYYEHKNLVYGADWSYMEEFGDRGKFLISTCSFYDHLLCLSSFNLNKS